MKISNYFFIGFMGLMGLIIFPILLRMNGIETIRIGWEGLLIASLMMIPTVFLLIYFEGKVTILEHTKTCKCTCGNCCENPVIKTNLN